MSQADLFLNDNARNLGIIIIIIIDYSIVLDMINHELLLSILYFIGLGTIVITFLKNYLSERIQKVVYKMVYF